MLAFCSRYHGLPGDGAVSVQIPHLFPKAPDVQVSQPSSGCTWGTAESSCSTRVALSSVSASTQYFFLDSLRKITSVTLKATKSKSQEKYNLSSYFLLSCNLLQLHSACAAQLLELPVGSEPLGNTHRSVA